MEKWYPQPEPIEGKKYYEVYYGKTEPCKICPSIRASESGSLQMDIVPWAASQKTMGWLELYAFPMLDSAGKPNGVVEYVRNVTDRVKAEQALLKSEQRYRMVADFTYDWEYWIAADGKYLYVSPSCERITGYTADEYIRDPGLQEKIVHPDDRQVVAEHLVSDMQSPDAASLEFRIMARTGDQRWIAHMCQPVYGDEGSFLGRRASNHDISDRKRAEEALQKAHEKLEERVTERTAELLWANDLLAQEIEVRIQVEAELQKSEEIYRMLVETMNEGLGRAVLKASKIRLSQAACFCCPYNILINILKLTVQKISCTEIYQNHAKLRYLLGLIGIDQEILAAYKNYFVATDPGF
jgi:PAS domain S-box-containing protein